MLMDYAVGGRWPGLLLDMQRMQGEMNRLLGGLQAAPAAEFPAINLWAGNDGAILAAEIPGVDPEKLDVTVLQDTVTLTGTREPEPPLSDKPSSASDDDEPVLHRRERPMGAFSRTVVLPFRVDAESVATRFANGVLTLQLSRPAADKPRQIKVARA